MSIKNLSLSESLDSIAEQILQLEKMSDSAERDQTLKLVQSQWSKINQELQKPADALPPLESRTSLLIRGLNGKIEAIGKKIAAIEPKHIPNVANPTQPILKPSGLKNSGEDCAFISLFQLIAHIPVLSQTCDLLPKEFSTLKELLKVHVNDEIAQRTSTVDIKKFRQLMTSQFQGFQGEPLFSAKGQEDAYEIFTCLMERIPTNILSSTMTSTRCYEKTGAPREPDRTRLEITRRDPSDAKAYSTLDENLCSIAHEEDFQILLDLKDKGVMSFDRLLQNYFIDSNQQHSEPSTYLDTDNKLYDYQLKAIRRQYTVAPGQLIVALKRFHKNDHGLRTKILNPLKMPTEFNLPSHAVADRSEARYALEGFILHQGSKISSGHYIAGVKLQGKWMEFNDGSVRELSLHEVNQALSHSYFHVYRQLPMDAQTASLNTSIELALALKEHEERQIHISALQDFVHALDSDTAAMHTAFSKLPEPLANRLLSYPWSRNGQKPLHKQLLQAYLEEHEMEKIQIAMLRLMSFKEMLLNPATNPKAIRKGFAQLTQNIDGSPLNRLIEKQLIEKKPQRSFFEQIKSKLLTFAAIPTQEDAPLLDPYIQRFHLLCSQMKNDLYKKQLIAFHSMLSKIPELPVEALSIAYAHLAVHIRETLESAALLAYQDKEQIRQAVQKNPRILLGIKEPVLETNSAHSLVEQLIHQFTAGT